MTMNPLPPQAYTKDTLLKAYQWLTTQGPSIKEIATTPDILVSLYLKATRDGDSALERPSIQNFKNELKSLAGMMGELDKPQVATAQSSYAPPSVTPPGPPSPAVVFSQAQSMPHFTAPPTSEVEHSHSPASLDFLDSNSKSMIREVKEEFNLSSDIEALRMLIKVGHTRSKALLR